MLLPHVLRFNMETLGPRYALAARRLGISQSDDDSEACEALFKRSMGLAALTQAPADLPGFGVAQDQIPHLTDMALLSQATHRNGRPMSAEQITKLYQGMF